MKLLGSIILGFVLLTSCNGCNSNASVDSNNNSASTSVETAKPPFQIVAQYPHSNTSFTEGLEYHDSTFIESTGLNGQSKLARTDIKTGRDILKIDLDKKFFGEGITQLNGKIYQLTYKEEKCFVYDAKTFKKLNELSYKGEGWGMTNNGKQIIMSNGSNNLYYRNANTFIEENVVAIFDENGPLGNINELEYVDGFVYANIWYKSYIAKIDPKSGRVVAKYDFAGLISQYLPGLTDEAVLNGIAYNKSTKNFYITGKNWPLVFEIKFN
ncbi:MAG: glutaminyl-peptide cyclotransferase [Chitinophagaceae bacterium]